MICVMDAISASLKSAFREFITDAIFFRFYFFPPNNAPSNAPIAPPAIP